MVATSRGGFALPRCGNRNKMRAAIDPFVCTAGQPHLRGEPTNCVRLSVFLSSREIACGGLQAFAGIGRRVSRTGGGTKPDSINEDADGAADGAGGHQFRGRVERDSEPQWRVALRSAGASYGYRNVRGSGSNSDSARLRDGNCGCARSESRDDWRIVGGSGSERRLGRYAAYAGDFGYVRESARGTNYQTGRLHQGCFYNCFGA